MIARSSFSLVLRLVVLAAGAASAVGQRWVVVPSAAERQDGMSLEHAPGIDRKVRQQVVIAESLVASLRGSTIEAMTFRRDGFLPALAAASARWTVSLSASPALDPAHTSSRFTANHKTAAQVVFSGTVTFPASPRLPHRHAATWDAGDTVSIALTAPFLYAGGGLCVQIDSEPIGTPASWWPLDVEADGIGGTRTFFGLGCGDVAGRVTRTGSVDARALRAGSTVRFVNIAAAGSPAVMLLSLNILPAPVDLAPFGAPGCVLWVLPDVLMMGVARMRAGPLRPGAANMTLELPTSGAVLGACLHTQWVNFEGARMTTTNAIKAQIASQPASLGAAMVRAAAVGSDPLPEVGEVEPGRMPVVRFTLR
jgi:hypothetical protein